VRILLVHNRYQQLGGEDAVFEAEHQLLLDHGHPVEAIEFSNHDIPARPGSLQQLQLLRDTTWSRAGASRVADGARRHQAQLVHFHNTFPLVSPAAYRSARSTGAATVQTLHNYRLVCPNGLLFRDNQPCHDCLGRTVAWPGVQHACYRESRPQTLAVAAMQTTHRLLRTWRTQVDRYIALTGFGRDRFLEGGLPPHLVETKPNFIADPLVVEPPASAPRRNGYLFVGRLSTEKGLDTLLQAWRNDPHLPPLHVAGDGALREDVNELALSTNRDTSNVTYLGQLTRPQVLDEFPRATALVFPSTWYEGFPVTIAEAFATGTPVIASNLGAMAEIVTDGYTGLLFTPGDPADLAEKVRWAEAHPTEMASMGRNARAEYEAKYTPDANYQQLIAIYQRALEHRQANP